MGTRKTALMIRVAAELWARKLVQRALIITRRRGVPQVLEEQIPRHMPKEVAYRAGELPSNKTAREFQYPRGDLLIGVASPGAFQSAKQTRELVEFVSPNGIGGSTVVFVDECQDFKGWDSLRAKNLRSLMQYSAVTRKYILSGEPAPLGYIDLYSEFYLLDPNIFGHASLTSFKNYYAVTGGYEGREL